MRKYLADTNILIHQIRESEAWEHVEKSFFPKGIKGYGYVSYVTYVEVLSFAHKNKWAKAKKQKLREALRQYKILHISEKGIANAYVNMDAYSVNRHKSRKLPKRFPAKKMGKNDLWIAATAAALNLPLISTDKDFEHLHQVFLELHFLDVKNLPAPPHA